MMLDRIDIEQLGTSRDAFSDREEKEEEPQHSFEFNFELIRIFSYLYFVVMFLICIAITGTEVTFPQNTEMNKIFGFNHLVMAISFNPARQIGAVLAPGFILPMSYFVIISYNQMKIDYTSELRPLWLWRYTQITTPFNLLALLEFTMAFVNGPEGEYGFLAHFIPFFLLMSAFGFMAIQQMLEGIASDSTPFEAPVLFTKLYTVALVVVMLTYQIYIISALAGASIFEKSHPESFVFSKILVNLYSVQVIGMPTIFSLYEKNIKSDTFIKVY